MNRNQYSMWYYISVILGLILMIAGIVIFIVIMINPAGDFKDSDESEHSKSDTIENDQTDYIDFNISRFDISDPVQNDPIDYADLLIGAVALFIFFGGFLVTMNGLRLKRSATRSTVDPVELMQLNRNVNEEQTGSTTLDETAASSQSSKDCKRAKLSHEDDEEVEKFIPKTYVHLETAAPKRINPIEKFHFIPPNDVDNLVLFPTGYPDVICDDNILEIVHRIISESQINLRTKYITLEDGYIKIEHLTNPTREYFQRTDPNSILMKLQSEIDLNMNVRPFQYFSKFIILSCILEEQIEDSEFLPTVYMENGIETSRCIFEKCESNEDGFKLFFGVTPMCFKQIKNKDNLLNIRQNLTRITMEKNPFPELFAEHARL